MLTYTQQELDYFQNIDLEIEVINYQLRWDMNDEQYTNCPINWDIIERHLDSISYSQLRWLESIARSYQIWSAVQLIVTHLHNQTYTTDTEELI